MPSHRCPPQNSLPKAPWPQVHVTSCKIALSQGDRDHLGTPYPFLAALVSIVRQSLCHLLFVSSPLTSIPGKSGYCQADLPPQPLCGISGLGGGGIEWLLLRHAALGSFSCHRNMSFYQRQGPKIAGRHSYTIKDLVPKATPFPVETVQLQHWRCAGLKSSSGI